MSGQFDFKMDELDAGDGSMWTGANPQDVFDRENLLEVGLSPELAKALDGKTVGEFQEIVTNTIENEQPVNLEMYIFAQQLFASYHDTGYENDSMNNLISGFDSKLVDAWPTREVQGLAYSYEGLGGAIEGKNGSPALPVELQVQMTAQELACEQAAEVGVDRTSYFGIGSCKG